MNPPRRSLRLLILALIVLGLSGTAALAAPKDQIRQKRAEAQAAREQVAALGMQLEPAIEQYNKAQAELATVRADVALNERRIELVRGNVRASHEVLDAKLVQDYKYGEGDAFAAILSSGSISSILDAADLLSRSQLQVADLLKRLQADQRELAQREAALVKAQARAVELENETRAEKERIDAALAQQKALVVGLEDQIGQLEAEERARQQRIAEEARRRLDQLRQAAELAAAANPAPQIGGSAADTIVAGGSSSGGSSGGGGASIPAPPPTDGSLGARAVAVAMQFLGTPYVWGGAAPGGFDCSGLISYAYGQLGIGLPHFTGALWNVGHRVSQSELIPGDLVFFYSDLHHVGMYIGGGQFIHAPHTGDVVKISSLAERAGVYSGAVRPY
jgi:cell wall-associated NlpC family hydrolase